MNMVCRDSRSPRTVRFETYRKGATRDSPDSRWRSRGLGAGARWATTSTGVFLTWKNTHKTAWTGGTTYTPSYIVPREPTRINYSCNAPSLTFAQVLRVFLANSSAGYPNNLTKDEMLVSRFYDRAADILTNLSLADGDSFLDLLNPASTTQPVNEFCSPIIISPFP